MAKANKEESINIPMHLARMLVARPNDLKDPNQYEDVQELAKQLLIVLIEAN